MNTKVKKLTPETDKNAMITFVSDRLIRPQYVIKDEKGTPFKRCSHHSEVEIETRVRDARTYIGLGIIGIGFVLQLLVVLLSTRF